jgi:hypothetical protein
MRRLYVVRAHHQLKACGVRKPAVDLFRH